MKFDELILVDEKDNPVGKADKMDVHRRGLLHRAFSVFIFNSKGEMLLQQRAMNKYHSGGLWTNACCSHPVHGEEMDQTIQRRLLEEMGFQAPVEKIFDFTYKESFENGLTEYEFDHVFAGEFDGEVNCNKNEVMDFCYKSMQEISRSVQEQPLKYTIWFRLAFPEVQEWWNLRYRHKVA